MVCVWSYSLTLLIKTTLFLIWGVFFWFESTRWVYLTYVQISYHNQIEWLKETHVFQGPNI
jgi:hypothetical protein